MTFRDVTRAVIKRVEDVSGCPVVVSEDASLKTLAASRIARGENRFHTISFNPSAVKEPDYLICYQCGFILRLFAVPASERIDLASTTEGRRVMHRLLKAPDGPGRKLKLSPEAIEGLRDQLFDGLMTQLRSIPIGFRVDAWIMREYPELAPRTGLDTNDPAPKFQLKSLPGNFSGLNLVCLMYVAFKSFAPEMDIGFDLSKEYAAAKDLQGEQKTH